MKASTYRPVQIPSAVRQAIDQAVYLGLGALLGHADQEAVG
jgi:hypothetical protein